MFGMCNWYLQHPRVIIMHELLSWYVIINSECHKLSSMLELPGWNFLRLRSLFMYQLCSR